MLHKARPEVGRLGLIFHRSGYSHRLYGYPKHPLFHQETRLRDTDTVDLRSDIH